MVVRRNDANTQSKIVFENHYKDSNARIRQLSTKTHPALFAERSLGLKEGNYGNSSTDAQDRPHHDGRQDP